jgi:putative copper export protein
MFGAGALVAMARSDSGHAADWGDLTWPEVIDWVHLMAGSVWGGGLIALSFVLLPATFRLRTGRRRSIAVLAQRFSTLASIALTGVLLTGLYNAWVQLGGMTALWGTAYGRILLGKLLLVMPLVALGASNHYISVPRLRRWSAPPGPGRPRNLERPQRRASAQGRPRAIRLMHRFARKVGAEALFVGGILLCTALLLHGAPARHNMHGMVAPSGQSGKIFIEK